MTTKKMVKTLMGCSCPRNLAVAIATECPAFLIKREWCDMVKSMIAAGELGNNAFVRFYFSASTWAMAEKVYGAK